MRAALGLLTVGLTAQATFGKLHVEVTGVQPVQQRDGFGGGFANVLQEETAADNVHQLSIVPGGDRELQPFSIPEHSIDRQLATFTLGITLFGFEVNIGASIRVDVTIFISKPFPQDPILRSGIDVEASVNVDVVGTGKADVGVDEAFLSDDKTDLCDTCTLFAVANDCTAGECDGYDKDGTNANLVAEVSGDPHMVGLLGQKIDWAGVDNAWYCLLKDGPDFHVNVRLSAPMPEAFPDRQLISAVSFLSDDGHSSLVVEVRNPYTTATNGCPEDSSVPCLADGGIRILVDGEESTILQAPTVNVRLPGSSPVVVSAANLPAECRPFGGDRIWATQFNQIMAKQRGLRLDSVSLGEWIMQPHSLAAPTWCANFLEEGGSAGLLSTRSEHATIRVETSKASVRINVGVNYQDLDTSPDGNVLVPELEFWQTDLGFDGLQLSENVAGLMGDTSRFVHDDDGVPVTSGLSALHGVVESYRVSGPFGRDFEKLHG